MMMMYSTALYKNTQQINPYIMPLTETNGTVLGVQALKNGSSNDDYDADDGDDDD